MSLQVESSTESPVYAVVGATGGIGAALCRRLAARGARLFLGGRDEAKLSALTAATNAAAQNLDATEAHEVDAFIAQAVTTYGQLDGDREGWRRCFHQKHKSGNGEAEPVEN